MIGTAVSSSHHKADVLKHPHMIGTDSHATRRAASLRF